MAEPPILPAVEAGFDDADGRYVGRAAGLPAPTDGVVHPEGPAEDEAPAQRAGAAITAHLFPHGGEPEDVPPADLGRQVCAGENFLWVDLSEYASGELHMVADSLGLHPDAVRNTLAPWTPPRLDLFGEQFYVAATLPGADPSTGRVEARQLDLLAGPGFLISAHKQPLPFLDGALARARRNPELLHRSPAFMLYILLDELLGYYERLQESTQQEIEVMEERALMDSSDAYLRDLVSFKRYAFSVAQLAEQHREILAAFLRPDFGAVPEGDVEVYFRDLVSRHTRLVDALARAKESVNGAFDIYVSRVAHHTNRVMRLLTVVSTVLLPVTVILGFFGVSNLGAVPVLQQREGFLAMIISSLFVFIVILAIFRRRGWL